MLLLFLSDDYCTHITKHETCRKEQAMTHSIDPITTTGWHENTDGTVTRHAWIDGRLQEVVTVGGWNGVIAYKKSQEEAINEALCTPPRCEAGVYVSAMRALHPN